LELKRGGDPERYCRLGLEEISVAIRDDPGDLSAIQNRGNLYLILGERALAARKDPRKLYRMAIEDLDRVLAADPSRWILLSVRGAVALRVAFVEESLGLDPGRSFEEAARDLEKALLHSSKDLGVLSNLGTALENLGRFSRATEIYDMGCSASGNNPAFAQRANRARIISENPWSLPFFRADGLLRGKRYGEAEKAYEKGIEGAKAGKGYSDPRFRPVIMKAHFELACMRSRSLGKGGKGEDEKAEDALQNLEKALEFGFRDFARIEKSEALAPLRERPEFEAILSKWKKEREVR
jgi:tetratricopeptide (TPR) repeat protein